ncbi:Uncharacterised protein [Raoultella planticola]|uniref:Uncharacterized protein n=1 Tax=Raoultella planticola TaxID=575 RepID=A0A485CCY5_RAOPL|nr:Uncharacterised protein [Raoultella planticola]
MNNKTRNTSEIINRGRNVLHEEAKAIISATSNINDKFCTSDKYYIKCARQGGAKRHGQTRLYRA